MISVIFDFYLFLVLVLVSVNEFVIFSFLTIFVFVFINENYTAHDSNTGLKTTSLATMTCPMMNANT